MGCFAGLSLVSISVLVLLAFLFASLWMVVLWLYAWRHNDAGVVDVGWSLGLGLVVLFYAVASAAEPIHRLAAAAVMCPWSFRLGYYLLIDRVRGKSEDGRYQALRAQWGAQAHRKFFVFFQFQAALVGLFSVPALIAMHAGGAPIFLVIGVVWGLLAIVGESIADAQLRRFRLVPAHRGKSCRAGLWRYSRHPNYFFEWLHWWAYVIMALPTLWAIPALMGPVLMALFLFRVTGIPYTEAQALRSRGDDYRAYQQETSVFIPWPPRKGQA